jgi:hypothetical protein
MPLCRPVQQQQVLFMSSNVVGWEQKSQELCWQVNVTLAESFS